MLNALDRDFPGWQNLVPAEKDSELNEDSLIQLIKNNKRAEIYRTIADKRNTLMKEAYDGSDKSFLDLAQEFTTFSYEQTQKWAEIEGKLSSIWLEFKAKSEPVDINSMSQGLEDVSNSIKKGVDGSVQEINTSVDNYLGSFFNKNSAGISRVGSDELKSFLKNKVPQFKAVNQKIGEKQKEFINNSVKALIQSKIDQIKSGKLSPDALDRSDLFTDEEMNELRNKHQKVIVESIMEIKNSNVNTVNAMSSQFMGVTGKENVLNKLGECPEEIISPEIKQIVSEAIDYGCIFEEEGNAGTGRQKRAIGVILANAACMLLDTAAIALEQMAENSPKPTFDTQKGFYYFCNEQTRYWAHLFTLGVCSAYTLGVNIHEAKKGNSMDYKGMANVLSGFSFLIGLFTGKSIRDSIKKVTGINKMKLIGKHVVKSLRKDLLIKGADEGCSAIGAEDGDRKMLSIACKLSILSYNLNKRSEDIGQDIRELMKKT